ncbi:MAG: prephenate dehydrogenase [bacterium]|nr:prephenate dehydrogenase [bacterium]
MSKDKNNFKYTGFIGLGVIGASIALMIRERYPEIKIFGFATKQTTIDYALQNDIIEEGTICPDDIPDNLDLVFICTPVNKIISSIEMMVKKSKKDIIITDIGSIKENISENIPNLQPGQIFIPGHPMAGSEKTGITAASSSLLKHAAYILNKQPVPQYGSLFSFLESLSFRMLELDSTTHDELVCYASHFPYIMAQLTVEAAESVLCKNFDTFKQVVSSGYRDTTRVASADPDWGTSVCNFNSRNILKAIKKTRANLSRLEKLIEKKDIRSLENLFLNNKNNRDALYT